MNATEEQIILLGFSPNQLACRCCGQCNVSIELLQRMRAFFDLLDAMMTLQITSCYRCEQHNKEVGGAPRSKHLTGEAMDITGNQHDLRFVDIMLNNNWHGGFHFYPGERPSIHLDIGRTRRW